MRQILLTGTYCSQNKGDAAMQIATAQELWRQLGADVRVTVASPFPELDRPVYAPYGLEVTASHRRKLGRCLAQMALGRLGAGLAARLGSPDAEAIHAADAVIDLSGDALSEDYGPHVVLSHLYPIWLALQMDKPVMLCAQTLGPFRTLRPVVRRVLSRVACITARDRATESLLRDLGIQGPALERTADMAHLLEPAGDAQLEQLLSGAPEAVRNGPRLGATVTRLLGHRQSLGLSGRLERVLGALARAFGGLLDRHGLSLLLLAHSTGPRPARDDRLITRRLAEQLGRPEHVHFVDEDLSPAEVKGLVSRCDLFCAMRLHSAIAALSTGVPCVTVGYGPKALGLMEGWGQARRTLPLGTLDGSGLLAALESAWQERAAIRDELAGRRSAQLERARANVALARSILGN
jgi:colanic acid/amylovoran biosynthesis protein WcaK/AmsJ